MNDQSRTPAAQQNVPKAPARSPAQQMQALLNSPIPKIYANGIGTAPTRSDISIVLLHNGVATGIITLPLSAAKSLTGDIAQALEEIEKKTGQKVRDLKDLAANGEGEKAG